MHSKRLTQRKEENIMSLVKHACQSTMRGWWTKAPNYDFGYDVQSHKQEKEEEKNLLENMTFTKTREIVKLLGKAIHVVHPCSCNQFPPYSIRQSSVTLITYLRNCCTETYHRFLILTYKSDPGSLRQIWVISIYMGYSELTLNFIGLIRFWDWFFLRVS